MGSCLSCGKTISAKKIKQNGMSRSNSIKYGAIKLNDAKFGNFVFPDGFYKGMSTAGSLDASASELTRVDANETLCG